MMPDIHFLSDSLDRMYINLFQENTSLEECMWKISSFPIMRNYVCGTFFPAQLTALSQNVFPELRQSRSYGLFDVAQGDL